MKEIYLRAEGPASPPFHSKASFENLELLMCLASPTIYLEGARHSRHTPHAFSRRPGERTFLRKGDERRHGSEEVGTEPVFYLQFQGWLPTFQS